MASRCDVNAAADEAACAAAWCKAAAAAANDTVAEGTDRAESNLRLSCPCEETSGNVVKVDAAAATAGAALAVTDGTETWSNKLRLIEATAARPNRDESKAVSEAPADEDATVTVAVERGARRVCSTDASIMGVLAGASR